MHDLFFRRIVRFVMLDDHVVALDNNQPRMITLDSWPELIFQMADGEHTIGELIQHLGTQYEGGMPEGLPDQIFTIVSQLVDEGLIELASDSRPLPPEFAVPASQQNR